MDRTQTPRPSAPSVAPSAEAAVRAARAAQTAWAARDLEDRLRPITALRHKLGRRPEAALVALSLAALDVAALSEPSAGRPEAADSPGWRAEALSAQVIPLADACRFLERSAADLLAPRRPGGEGRPAWLAGVDLTVERQAHGIVLVVAPSNYPLFLPGVQVVQALAAGNAVLLKPGAGGTGAALWLAGRLADGGLPEGLLAVLPEDPDSARRAVEVGVDRVFLTGSAETGEALLADLAPRLTPATLELSGNDALVALEGADPEMVASALAFGLRLHGSATCIAPRRAFVHRSLIADVESGLVRRLGAVASQTADLACVPSGKERQRVERLVAEAVEAGGRLLAREGAGGTVGTGAAASREIIEAADGPSNPSEARSGTSVAAPGRDSANESAPMMPLVVVGAPGDAGIRSAALFAPVLTLDPVEGADEAVRRANASPYALGASVFGPAAAARTVARRLDAGVVTLNDVIVPTADPRLPFGGRRRSGYGVTRGAEGLLAMTVPRAVTERRLPGRWASRFAPPHRHFEAQVPEDEALFTAWLAVAHGGSLGARFRALPRLLRALRARGRADRSPAPASPSTLPSPTHLREDPT